MQTIQSILKRYWNYDTFRPLQEDIIQNILNGKDTLGILPTGGGKSICYQVPALCMKGNCLVVSPLIALMKDQASSLIKKGIQALVIHSGMSSEEVRINYEKMCTGDYKFLFVSPERLKSNLFLDFLHDWNVQLLVVDEAHCISQWGYDFRPAYLDIAMIRQQCPGVPILALTASATPLVQIDIREKLLFNEGNTFFSTFTRSNLSFSCFEVENKIIKTIEILTKLKGSSLVYCRNRKRTKELSDQLNASGLRADFYHAGLAEEVRSQRQDEWMQNKINIMVCTNAFGMGIDKGDVRCVIHYDIPDTPEAYYQEAGRAGRDGEKAYAILLFQKKDLKDLRDGILLKYPDVTTIRDIYESLAYYFEVGLEQGMETSFDFDPVDFCRKFEFNLFEVLSTVKILEQQGYWILNESVYQPSRIAVTCSKQDIESLEKNHPELDEILKHVLRMYAGIWNHSIQISELQIAQHALVSKDYVQMILRKLHGVGIIQYQEAKEKPQLLYLHDRVPKDQLQLDTRLMRLLKERYTERVTFMIDYASQQLQCRANRLIAYFSEKIETPCGICDLCLIQKQKSYSKAEFDQIKNNILHEVALSGAMSIDLFCKNYSSLRQEQVKNIIRFLLEEGKLVLNEAGELTAKI